MGAGMMRKRRKRRVVRLEREQTEARLQLLAAERLRAKVAEEPAGTLTLALALALTRTCAYPPSSPPEPSPVPSRTPSVDR